jgi:RNA polymerase sigma factor for flagellar operon FliA
MPIVRQVVQRALRRLPPSVQRDDLLAAGTVGLFDALRRGGAGQNVGFRSYARIRIEGAIVDELRIGDTCTRRERRAERAGGHLDVPLARLEPLPDDVPDASLSALEKLEAASDGVALGDAIAALTEREQTVIKMHFMEDRALGDAAERLRVTLSRASQIKKRALLKLRSMLADGARIPATGRAARAA